MYFLIAKKNSVLVPFISDFGVPGEIRAQAAHPHCLHVTWKKAAGPVSGYRVYCFSGESTLPQFIKDIHDKDTECAIVSGLSPNTQYRVGVASLSNDIESNTVFSEEKLKTRKFYENGNIIMAENLKMATLLNLIKFQNSFKDMCLFSFSCIPSCFHRSQLDISPAKFTN